MSELWNIIAAVVTVVFVVGGDDGDVGGGVVLVTLVGMLETTAICCPSLRRNCLVSRCSC